MACIKVEPLDRVNDYVYDKVWRYIEDIGIKPMIEYKRLKHEDFPNMDL